MCEAEAKAKGGMGFRDLSNFNQVLVAKQSWRVMQEPDSLVARVLKARYFKSGDFIQATVGSSPSFIWRSILWGREVMLKRAIWRIGIGNKARAFFDNWIPRPTTYKPIAPSSLALTATVDMLINERNQWNEALIRQHFLEIDAYEILKIPLPKSPKDDQIMWFFDKNGEYSVRSGYQVAQQIKSPDKPSCSDDRINQWKSIWSKNIRAKIKIFYWKASRNLLPTVENLWRRKIIQDPFCQRCKDIVETISHSLFTCKVAQKTWKLSQFDEVVTANMRFDHLTVILNLSKTLSPGEIELFVAISWSVWYVRNLAVLEQKREEPGNILSRAEATVMAYRRIKGPVMRNKYDQQGSRFKEWQNQPQMWYKMNTDAAIHIGKQCAGLGVVIRDSNGNLMCAAIGKSNFVGHVAAAEVEAINFGLDIIMGSHFQPIVIESDCLNAVNLIVNRKDSSAVIGWIIEDVKKLRRMKDFKICHVPRMFNAIAHALASLVIDATVPVIWKESFPSEILYLLSSS